MSDKSTALTLMNKLGGEITWEFLQTEGVWYAWVSHSGSIRKYDNFKFSASGKTLTTCIKKLYHEVRTCGPHWARR